MSAIFPNKKKPPALLVKQLENYSSDPTVATLPVSQPKPSKLSSILTDAPETTYKPHIGIGDPATPKLVSMAALPDQGAAAVSYTRNQQRGPDYWRAQAEAAARKHGIDPHYFANQMSTESIGFDEDVISGKTASPAGAQGIAQMMPGTAKGWGVNPLNPHQALDAAAEHMAQYLKQYHGSWRDALTAYNAGAGRVGKPLYDETRNYIDKILSGKSDSTQKFTPGAASASSPKMIGMPTPVGYGHQAGAIQSGWLGDVFNSMNQSMGQDSARLYKMLDNIGKPGSFGDYGQSDNESAKTYKLIESLGDKPPARLGNMFSPAGNVAKTLVIGDSLGAGTLPELKKLLGGRVSGNVKMGRASAEGLQILKRQLNSGNYGNIVWDLGTNDASASQTRAALAQVLKLAPNAQIFIPTINSPFQASQKNKMLQLIAASNPNVHLIPWRSQGAQFLGGDGIHATGAGYQSRANMIASALGYTSQAHTTQGGAQGTVDPGNSRFRVEKIDGHQLTRPDVAWNPQVKPMAPWLAEALDWAHHHGWTGTVSSGYRTHDEQQVAATNYGLQHYPNGPQASNHRSGNAVDVTNPEELDKVLRNYRGGRRPIWAGPVIGDTVHFSDNGH